MIDPRIRLFLLGFLFVPSIGIAQHLRIIPGVGWSGIIGDPNSQIDEAYSIGVGVADTLSVQWGGELSLSYVHSTYTGTVDGYNYSIHAGSANAVGLLTWRTDEMEVAPILAVGFFGSKAESFYSWSYGPVVGVGIGWPDARLLISMQSSIEDYGTGHSGLLLATLGVDLW
jgi:hypothetical protein